MAKLQDKVKVFAQNSPKLFDAFQDYYNQSRAEAGVKGVMFDTTHSKEDKGLAINKLFVAELEKRSKTSVLDDFDGQIEAFANHTGIRSFADVVVSYLIDSVLPDIKDSALGLIADFKFVGLGDTLNFKVKNNGLFAVSEAGRRQRHTPSQKITNNNVTVTTTNHAVTVDTTLLEILTNRESLAEFILKAVKSIQAEMTYDAIDAFQAVFEDVTVPTELKLTSYAEKTLLELCQKVTAWNGGEKAVIIGTPVALKTILPSATGLSINLTDTYVTQGYLPMFNTYKIVPLEQMADLASTTYGLKITDNRLYVVSPSQSKIIKIGVEGISTSNTDAPYANADLSVRSTITKAWGTGVATNAIAGVVQLSVGL